MTKHFVSTIMVMVLSCGICMGQGARRKPDEKKLLELWQLHEATKEDRVPVIKAALQYKKDHKFDPLGTVSQSIAAWHLLKLNKIAAGVTVLTPISKSKTTDLQKAAARMSENWLTRIDMMTVKAHLELYYKEHIAYPATLEPFMKLPEDKRPPVTDRWGKPWDYKLVGFKMFEGLLDKKYSIKCASLMREQDYTKALALDYAEAMKIRAVNFGPKSSRGTSIIFETIPEKVVMSEYGAPPKEVEEPKRFSMYKGINGNGMYLAYIGEQIIIVADENHWKIMSRPRR